MAISYVGGATGVSVGNTDVSVSLTALTGGSGSAPIEGDLVIFAYNIADADNVDLDLVMVTAGYTQVADLFGNGTQDANLGVFYKFMGPTPDTVAVGEGSLGGIDTAIQGVVMVFRGVAPVAAGGPFDVTSTTATGTTTGDPDPPSIDTTGAAGIWTVIVGACAHAANVNGTFAGPTNYTTDFLAIGNQDTADGIIGMGYRTDPADPENPGLITTATTATGWCAVTMALKEGAVVTAGDLAATESADVGALAGTVLVEGALAASEAADAVAAAGDVIVAGALAATEAVDALAASGTVADASITGDLAAVEATDTAALAGDVLVAGALVVSEGSDTLGAAGAVIVAGALAAAEASDTASALGDVLVAGAMSVTETGDAFDAAGEITVAGGLAVTEAADVLAAMAGGVATGEMAAVEAADAAAFAVGVLVTGSMSADEISDALVGSGIVHVTGGWTASEQSDIAALVAQLLVQGQGSWTEAPDVFAAAASASTFIPPVARPGDGGYRSAPPP